MEIVVFDSIFKNQVIDLILNIQQNEFKVPISIKDQPDLNQIESYYQTNKGNFWIALENKKIIGTIALLDIDNQTAVIRKMFVNQDFRGPSHLIGQSLMDKLICHAGQNHIQYLFLGTTEKMFAAHRFYEKNGFVKINKTELPELFPLVKVDTIFYKLKL